MMNAVGALAQRDFGSRINFAGGCDSEDSLSVGDGPQRNPDDGTMLLVLHLDPTLLGHVAGDELLANDLTRGPHGLKSRRERVPAMLADDVRRLEAVAAEIEIITRQATPDRRS